MAAPNDPVYPIDIVSIGECMVELARTDSGQFQLAFGGDTFNTAVYAARLGARVSYVTALGDDPYCAGIRETAESEGIDTSHIATVPGRMPGLYLIETQQGERSFWYWRDHSPARQLFELDSAGATLKALASARLIYFSGVTLSLYSPAGLDRFALALEGARARGARIVMDSNYRPRGWGGDVKRAQTVFQRFWALADIALPTFDDEQMLWGDGCARDTLERISKLGPREIVAKLGADGALVRGDDVDGHVACPAQIAAIDTTAAGDSFNAAYVCTRLKGGCVREAVMAAHRLAGIVVQHRGAIVPRAAMAGVS
ncbi:MAG TPA: sugar kinase [Hyphomicrobiaceae bacterium]|nr:sugar kinase [Hyphomicrobiaceae bacterium]